MMTVANPQFNHWRFILAILCSGRERRSRRRKTGPLLIRVIELIRVGRLLQTRDTTAPLCMTISTEIFVTFKRILMKATAVKIVKD